MNIQKWELVKLHTLACNLNKVRVTLIHEQVYNTNSHAHTKWVIQTIPKPAVIFLVSYIYKYTQMQ